MPTKERILQKMSELADKLHYTYHNLSHLARAMYCKKEKGHSNYTNDAMATLGDAVLKLIWSEYFFNQGMDKDEITEKKANVENNGTLKNLCDLIGAQEYAYNDLYFASEAPQSRRLPHRDHDFYIEAIIAAIYRDRGLTYTRAWVLGFWGDHPEAICPVPCKKRQNGAKKRG